MKLPPNRPIIGWDLYFSSVPIISKIAITIIAIAIKVSIVSIPGSMLGKGCVPKISQIGLELVEISVKTVLPSNWFPTFMSGANSCAWEVSRAAFDGI